VKFIVNAQLPRRLEQMLRSEGYDTIHMLDLPERNATADTQISRLSIEQNRVVISKDSDFYDSFLSKKEPYKLIYLTVGNCFNGTLLSIFKNNLGLIESLLKQNDVIQLS